MRVLASNFGTRFSTDLRIAATGAALTATACNAPSLEAAIAFAIGTTAIVGGGLYRWGQARLFYNQMAQKIRKGEIRDGELPFWMKIVEDLGSRVEKLTTPERNLLMRIYMGRGEEISREKVFKDLSSPQWSPKYILAYRLLFHFFQPQMTSSTQHLMKIASQGDFWGTIAYHVLEDKESPETSPFPKPYVRKGSKGLPLLTRVGQLMQKSSRYLLVETATGQEFRIGGSGHMDMMSFGEDKERVIGAGFIWIDDQSGEVVIDGKSNSFTTSLDDVAFNYSIGERADSAGLNQVAAYLKRVIFKRWSSVRVRVDIYL